MRLEIINRNQEGFQHILIITSVELISEVKGEYVEYSLGLTWFNLSFWGIWIK